MNYFLPKHESKATSISEKRDEMINHGLNRVANSFGISNFLLVIMIKLSQTSYRRISESFFFNWIVSTGIRLLHSWFPVRFFRMVAKRWPKMRAPVYVKDNGRFVVVYSMGIDHSTVFSTFDTGQSTRKCTSKLVKLLNLKVIRRKQAKI